MKYFKKNYTFLDHYPWRMFINLVCNFMKRVLITLDGFFYAFRENTKKQRLIRTVANGSQQLQDIF